MDNTKIISIKHTLSDADVNELARELAEKIREFGSIQSEKKAAMSEYKASQEVVNDTIQSISSKIMLGYYFEDKICYFEDDLEQNLRIYKDPDTHEIVRQDPLILDQPTLFEKPNDTQDENTVPEIIAEVENE